MIFDETNANNGDTIMFNLTNSEYNRVQRASFIQKDEILNQISRLRFTGSKILRLKNIRYVDGRFCKQEAVYFMPNDLDKLVSALMDISLSYAILWIDTNIMGFNEIALAKTAHNTTNIDGDVIGALVQKIGWNEDREEKGRR